MASDVKTARADRRRARFPRLSDVEGLAPIGARPRLGEYLAQLWDRRHFIWMDARHRGRLERQQERTGDGLWLLLRPLLDALMYYLIFGVILSRVLDQVENVPAFIIVGILMFLAPRCAARAPVRRSCHQAGA